jgi:hypothetical protein
MITARARPGWTVELDHLVDAHLRAELEGDVEAILAGMTDDIEHEVVGALVPPACGKAAVRARFVERFANTVTERHIQLRRLHGDGFVVDEVMWEGRVSGHLGQCVGRGRRLSHRNLAIFEVRDGLICKETSYPDFPSIARDLA